jgi:hypothetical protein
MISKGELLQQTVAAVARVFEVEAETMTMTQPRHVAVDAVVTAAAHTFYVSCLDSSAAHVAMHAEHVRRESLTHRGAVPLIVVPFMTDARRQACGDVSWLDLSGNAHIVAPGLRIIVEGHPDRFRKVGRPADVFAPKSARVARFLLMHSRQFFRQRDIAAATDMTEGFVSRIVARLDADGYVVREGSRVSVHNAAVLLNAWHDVYDFSKHTIIRGHIAARTGEALTRLIGESLSDERLTHAATGLCAAWQITSFAAFRTATFFVAAPPSMQVTTRLGFRPDDAAANTWFVVPNDRHVFTDAQMQRGVLCVHPVQAYLDLKGHHERAREAAEHLRAHWIGEASRD